MRTIGVLFVLCVMLTGAAQAESLTWRLRSSYPYIVHFQLFSDDRNHVWPSASRVWVLDDSEVHSVRISCNYGEKICYGAWPSGNTSRIWGVGSEGREGCEDCCYICDGGTTAIHNLHD